METPILILGAGPAGLGAALTLSRSGARFIVAEKNPQVGGLARTLSCNDFRTDIGPHRFHSKNKQLTKLVAELLPGQLRTVDRVTRFYANGRYLRYPLQLKNALLSIGIKDGFRILTDYSVQRLKNLVRRPSHVSFEEKIVSDFGRSLAELNMLNYTEKVWGLPCSEISPDWASQRIKELSLLKVFKKALFRNANTPQTLVDRFHYPDSGSGLLYENIRAEIEAGGAGRIRLNTYPVKIKHNGAEILSVLLRTPGGDEYEIPARHLISSIPITELISLLEPRADSQALAACKKLNFRAHVSLFIALNRESVFPDQWIYFPDKKIPFSRVMEPRNFASGLSPEGKTSLLIEFFCREGDDTWNATGEQLIESSLGHLRSIGLLDEKTAVIDSLVHREKYAYPVYDLAYKENLAAVKRFLGKFRNLQLIGRSGSFRYNNQDQALQMGIWSARNVTEGGNYSVDGIGSEQEYFETCA